MVGSHPAWVHSHVIVGKEQERGTRDPDPRVFPPAESGQGLRGSSDPRVPAAPLSQDLRRVVGRAIVDYDNLERYLTLLLHQRAQNLRQIMRTVASGYDDAYRGVMTHILSGHREGILRMAITGERDDTSRRS